jgi:hypothetical protein
MPLVARPPRPPPGAGRRSPPQQPVGRRNSIQGPDQQAGAVRPSIRAISRTESPRTNPGIRGPDTRPASLGQPACRDAMVRVKSHTAGSWRQPE